MSKNSKLWEVIRENKDSHWTVERHGYFTVAILEAGRNKTVGLAEKNATDQADNSIGDNIAIFRAAQKMMVRYPNNPLSLKLREAVKE